MIGLAVREGRQVRARSDIYTGLFDTLTGTPTVRAGARGLVVSVDGGGLLSGPRATVRFARGLAEVTVQVPVRQLRALALAGGDASFERRRAIARGVRLGLLAVSVPGIVSLIFYFASGGTVAELIAAAPSVVVGLAAQAVAVLGFGGTLITAVALWVWLRLRSR